MYDYFGFTLLDFRWDYKLNRSAMGNRPNFTEIRQRTIRNRDQHIDNFIPKFEQIIKKNTISPERIQHLTRLDLAGLVMQLNNQTVTSEQLVAIYGIRAATIGRRLCIITEDYFDYALKKAQQCDRQRSKSGKKNWTFEDEWDMNKFFPPLYGIPISVKENIEMEGTRSTIGLTIRADRINKQDCATIKCFKSTGLIPFIKTNLPQLAFNFDSANYLWGRTLNPWNTKKSAGGSSGGEGAGIAARVAPIGIGNDMAGSIRIPAQFNGVYGLMCGGDRLPFNGQITKYSTGFRGLDTIKAVNGPLSNSIDSLALWMRQMTTEQFYNGQHDPYEKLIPFDMKTYREISQKPQKFKIGYITSFDIIQPTTAVKRAVNQTVQFLQNDGHSLVEITIPNETDLIMAMFGELVGEGGFQSFMCMLQGQKLAEEYKMTHFVSNRGACTLSILKCLFGLKYPRLVKVLDACRNLSTHEYLENAGRIHQFRADWVKYWRAQKLDFVIFPGFATEASNHGSSNDGSLLASYTFVLNLLGMVSCAQPITVTKENQLNYQSDWEDPVTELIRNNLKDAQGLPVGIQVVGLPFSEERVLGLSKRIEQHFKFYKNHPLPNV